MARTRRDTLRLAGVSVAALAAGCLDDTPAGTSTDEPSTTPTDEPSETPTPGGQLPAELERVDEPPYEVTVPECGEIDSDGGDRDPLYLCANMPAEPSLSFTQSDTRGNVLADEGLELSESYDDQLFAALLTEAADRDRVASEAESETAQLIRETDFGTHAVLVVQTGWGSGSVYPQIERVETTDTGVHAFGCHSDPCIQTDDITSRTAAVRFERPATVETCLVSLTVAPDERWNAAAGEGVVTIPDS